MTEILIGTFVVISALSLFVFKRIGEMQKYREKMFFLCQNWNAQHLRELTFGEEENAFIWCYEKMPSMKSILFHNKELTDDLMLSTEMMRKLEMDIPLEKLSKQELQELLQEAREKEDYEQASLIRDVLSEK
jgi:hypothetical protein